jgi:hypothetical protein
MTREIPTPLRAAAGLAAFAVDEARRLPSRLSTLPIVAVGAAMQASMKMQQRYTELVDRGDKLLGGTTRTQERPPWARFDEDDRATATRVADAQSWSSAAEETIEEEISDVAEDASEYEDYLPGSPNGAAPPLAADLPAPADPPGLVDSAAPADASTPADLPAPADPPGLVDSPLAADPPVMADPPVAADPPVLADVAALADHSGAAGPPVVADLPAPAADAGLPLQGFDRLSLPQLRARLRTLSAGDLRTLIDYERTHQGRPPYLTMLENRLATVARG